MKKTKQIIAVAVLLVCGVAAYFAWAAWRAQRNLVTLDVRNMEVREVIAKLERQSWESIYIDNNVQGKVTLHVRGVPLDEVLRMIAGQTDSRPLVLFALYSSQDSFHKLEQSVRGDIDPTMHGWKNLVPALRGPMGPGPMMIAFGPGGGPFGAMPDTSNQRVSLDIRGKDLSFAVTAFGRFAQARVVPEDAASGVVTLSLNKVPVSKAVAKLADKVNRSSKKIYVLQGMRMTPPGRPGEGPPVAMRGGNGPERMMMQRGPGPGGPPEMTPQQRDEMRQQRETLEKDLMSALPTAERQKLEQQQAERQQQMQEMASMTPEQRRERMEQMMRANGGINQMLRQRVLNSTPEQRAEMIRREKEMRRRGMQPGG